MSRLFIIGNGFDLTHGLPTHYYDFHNYLKEQYSGDKEEYLVVPDVLLGHHGEDVQSDSDVSAMICNLLNEVDTDQEDWSSTEAALAKMRLMDCLDTLFTQIDEDGDYDWPRNNQNQIECCYAIQCVLNHITEYVKEWIDTIPEAESKNESFDSLIDPQNDLFLNFNYTKTLEELYLCKNVCHIHGVVGGECLFGHGGPSEFPYIGEVPEGFENDFQHMYDSLRKDTHDAFSRNLPFFEKVAEEGIREIYAIGFSFEDVDMIYVDEILKRIPKRGTTIYLNDYAGREEICSQINQLRAHGYDGKFLTFRI